MTFDLSLLRLATPELIVLLRISQPEVVTEFVQRRLPVLKVGSSNPSRVKPVTYKIDTCHYLAWRLVLIGYDNDWLVQYKDNVTEWDTGLLCWLTGLSVEQHYKVVIYVHCHKSVPTLI